MLSFVVLLEFQFSFAAGVLLDQYELNSTDSGSAYTNAHQTPDGKIFITGNLTDANGIRRALIRRGEKKGDKYSFKNVLELILEADKSTSLTDITSLGPKNLFAIGTTRNKTNHLKCILAESKDSGDSWTTTTLFSDIQSFDGCSSIQISKTHILLFGSFRPDEAGKKPSWAVYGRELAGKEWKILDLPFSKYEGESFAFYSSQNGSNSIFASGHATDKTFPYGVTRASFDGGLTWQTVDLTQTNTETGSRLFGSSFDPASESLFSCGVSRYENNARAGFWIRRTNSSDFKIWETVFSLGFEEETDLAEAGCSTLASNGQGKVVAIGYLVSPSRVTEIATFVSLDGGTSWKEYKDPYFLDVYKKKPVGGKIIPSKSEAFLMTGSIDDTNSKRTAFLYQLAP